MNTTKSLYLNTESDRDILDWLERQDCSTSQAVRRAIRYLIKREDRQTAMLERILREVEEIKERGLVAQPPTPERVQPEDADLPPDIKGNLAGLL